jgi:hypothetical protein
MRCIPNSLRLAALAAALWLAPATATAERDNRDLDAVRQAEAQVERLRTELARVNAEVVTLKRAHSMGNDYRLRERMADAEALARKLTAAEASLRAQRGAESAGAPIVAPPPVSPHDGSIELLAKADLLVDQARKLDGEADTLAKAAQELRSRRVMRRKAQSWERDPFSGLETSRRSVAATAPATKSAATPATTDSGSRSAGSTGATSPTAAPTGGGGPTPNPVVAPPPPAAVADSSEKAGTKPAAASDGAVTAKSSPIAPSGFADRQSVERRLYLDPATAAELRQALGPGGAALDPEALERGVAALRARARSLQAEAQSLRVRSRTP